MRIPSGRNNVTFKAIAEALDFLLARLPSGLCSAESNADEKECRWQPLPVSHCSGAGPCQAILYFSLRTFQCHRARLHQCALAAHITLTTPCLGIIVPFLLGRKQD